MDTELADKGTSRQSFKFAGRTHDFVDGDVVEVPKAPWGSFLFVVSMYYGFQWTESDIALNWLRTLVTCDAPMPKVGADGEGYYENGLICPQGSTYVGSYTLAPTAEPSGEISEADSMMSMKEMMWSTSTVSAVHWPTLETVPSANLWLGREGAPAIQQDGTVVDGECVAIPNTNQSWSMSPNCMDQGVVIFSAYQVIGSVVSFSTAGAMLATLFFGAAFIDSWGRKPMMLISFLAQILNTITNMVVTYSGLDIRSPLVFGFISFGALCASCLNTFAGAAGAMTVDGTPPDSTERSTRLVVFSVLRSLATVFNVAVTYVVLVVRLESYAALWPVYCAVLCCQLLLASCLLVETKPIMPEAATKPTCCQVVRREILAMFEICTADNRLHAGIWCAAVGGSMFGVSLSMASNWVTLVLGLDAATASLGGAWGSLWTIVGSGLSGPICIKCGQLKCLYIAQCLTILGFAAIPWGAILPQTLANVAFWVGVGPGLAMGIGLSGPAFLSLTSSRVAPENQGKFFSGLTLVTLFLSTVLMYLWTQFLIDPESDTKIADMVVGWWIGCAGQVGVIIAITLSWGFKDPQPITVGGSNVQFIEGTSGSRVIAGDEFQGKEGVEVKDGALHF